MMIKRLSHVGTIYVQPVLFAEPWPDTFLFLGVYVCLYACPSFSMYLVFLGNLSFFPCLLMYDQCWIQHTWPCLPWTPYFVPRCMLAWSYPLGSYVTPSPMLVFSVPRHSGLAERLPPRNGLWDVHRNFVPLFHWDDISTSQRVSCQLLAIQVFPQNKPKLMYCSSLLNIVDFTLAILSCSSLESTNSVRSGRFVSKRESDD